ncbi:MAG: enoyl-CoA hydratase/isomerase family protein [Candidatus Methylomirabilis sp.]
MAYQHILYQKEGGIASITVNRPPLNVLNQQAMDELEQALISAGNDAEVRVVILTGAGEKAFMAGADITEIRDMVSKGPLHAREAFARRGQRLVTSVERLGKPVIAAVNGYALGGGCEIVEAAHLAIASEHARFGQPEITLGFNPCWGGTQRLPQMVGRKRALLMQLTGQMIDAQEAFRIGLVNQVVSLAELLPAAERLARSIVEKSPVAVRLILEAVTHGPDMALDDGLRYEADLFGLACSTKEIQEGISAFIEKRRPSF